MNGIMIELRSVISVISKKYKHRGTDHIKTQRNKTGGMSVLAAGGGRTKNVFMWVPMSHTFRVAEFDWVRILFKVDEK